MHLLIVEDDTKTAAYLKKGLEEHGHQVATANDGWDGLHLAREVQFDLIVLDVMLPKLDGWAVLEHIRQNNKHTPVLFLTARSDIQDRVKGLNLGADDYLVKPFAFSELLARVEALARRRKAPRQDTLAAGDLSIDLSSRRVMRDDNAISLTQKELALLSLFLRHQGQLLTRTFIAEQVWDINFDTQTNVVDVAVKRLRRKVDDPFQKKLIHTVRGVGYVLEAR